MLYNTSYFFSLIADDASEEVWDDDDYVMDDFEPNMVTPMQLNEKSHPEASNLVKWIVRFVSFMQAVYQLSDKVTELWIKFLSVLFLVLGRFSPICQTIAHTLPKTFRSFTNSVNLKFRRYVVCKTCYQVYSFDNCIATSKSCSYIAFPNHPHFSVRQPCNTLLLKTVELSSGKQFFYPFLTYCYMSLFAKLSRTTRFFQFM